MLMDFKEKISHFLSFIAGFLTPALYFYIDLLIPLSAF